MNHSSRLQLVLAIALISLTACGNSGTTDVISTPESASESTPPEVSRINWWVPFEGVQVESSNEAASYAQFDFQEPQGLGEPARIYASDPKITDAGQREVAFVYDTSDYGVVDVIIKQHPLAQAEYEKGMREFVSGVRSGRAEVVSVNGGVFAVVTTTSNQALSDIRFKVGSVEVLIRGSRLDRTGALSLAEQI